MDTDRQTTTSRHFPTRPVLTQFDWTAYESAGVAVVEAVAAVSDDKLTDFAPLYETVETDALDAIVSADGQSSARGAVAVTFTFNGYPVEVSSSGDGYVFAGDADLGV